MNRLQELLQAEVDIRAMVVFFAIINIILCSAFIFAGSGVAAAALLIISVNLIIFGMIVFFAYVCSGWRKSNISLEGFVMSGNRYLLAGGTSLFVAANVFYFILGTRLNLPSIILYSVGIVMFYLNFRHCKRQSFTSGNHA